MGMFDYVKAPTIPCPECGKQLGGWQSKDGPWLLETIPPQDVHEFYAFCIECSTMTTYRREPPPDSDDPFGGFVRHVERIQPIP